MCNNWFLWAPRTYRVRKDPYSHLRIHSPSTVKGRPGKRCRGSNGHLGLCITWLLRPALRFRGEGHAQVAGATSWNPAPNRPSIHEAWSPKPSLAKDCDQFERSLKKCCNFRAIRFSTMWMWKKFLYRHSCHTKCYMPLLWLAQNRWAYLFEMYCTMELPSNSLALSLVALSCQFSKSMLGGRGEEALQQFWDHCLQLPHWKNHPAFAGGKHQSPVISSGGCLQLYPFVVFPACVYTNLHIYIHIQICLLYIRHFSPSNPRHTAADPSRGWLRDLSERRVYSVELV